MKVVESLIKQWGLCRAANPQGKEEWCRRPKCRRCNRMRDWRRKNRMAQK